MIYLDNAATTLVKPKEVVAAFNNAIGLTTRGNGGHQGKTIIAEARDRVASHLNAESSECVAFVKGATEALNIIINSYMHSGEHIITTRYEHNSVLRPIYNMIKNGSCYDFIDIDKNGRIPDNIENVLNSLVKKNTTAIIMGTASNVLGNSYDIKRIARFASNKGIDLILDATQSIGYDKLDMIKDDITAVCFSAHKGLHGLNGAGCLVYRGTRNITPLIYGGSGENSFAKDQGNVFPYSLEAGTPNVPAIAALNEAFRILDSDGELTRRKNISMSLVEMLYNSIIELPYIHIRGDYPSKSHLPILAIECDGFSSSELSEILEYDYNIIIRSGYHCAPLLHEALNTASQGLSRISFDYNNTKDEVLSLVTALLELKNII